MPQDPVVAHVQSWWNDAWGEGLWAASWSKSLEGLTAQQAAWIPPSNGRTHSIWQHVLHMCFWRDNCLKRVNEATLNQRPTEEDIKRLNFPTVTDLSEAAWIETKKRFVESQQRVAAAFDDPAVQDKKTLAYLLPHDCYHFGQINMIRGMQNFPPIE
jgi:hypothetical protein